MSRNFDGKWKSRGLDVKWISRNFDGMVNG